MIWVDELGAAAAGEKGKKIRLEKRAGPVFEWRHGVGMDRSLKLSICQEKDGECIVVALFRSAADGHAATVSYAFLTSSLSRLVITFTLRLSPLPTFLTWPYHITTLPTTCRSAPGGILPFRPINEEGEPWTLLRMTVEGEMWWSRWRTVEGHLVGDGSGKEDEVVVRERVVRYTDGVEALLLNTEGPGEEGLAEDEATATEALIEKIWSG